MTRDQMLSRLAPRSGVLRAVLDTDTFNEIDDQFALVQALLSPERLKLEAVYACPFHNKRSDSPGHGMELSYEEILRVLDRMARPATGFAFRGVREFVGPQKQPRDAEAVEHLIALARSASDDDPIHVIGIGAASNIASAILKAPDIVTKIVVVWLGGNAAHWPAAFFQGPSFNLRQDVASGQVLFDCGAPLVLVPASGVSSHLRSTVPEIERFVEPCGDIGRFLAERFKEYTTDHCGWSKEIWDMAAVGWLLDPDWAPSVIRPSPRIDADRNWTEDEARHPIRYVGYVHRDPIMRDFFDKLAAFAAGRP